MAKANGEDTTAAARVLDPLKFRRRRMLDDKLRTRLATAIEKLIEALDASEDTDEDSGADDEPCDDDEREPSLGYLNATTGKCDQSERIIGQGHGDELELDEADFEGDPDADQEGDGDCDDEHNGDYEPSLVSADGTAAFAAVGVVTDGEEGDLLIVELDRLRAKRPQAKTEQPEKIGPDYRLVSVTRRPNGSICNVRPLTPDEQARWLDVQPAPR